VIKSRTHSTILNIRKIINSLSRTIKEDCINYSRENLQIHAKRSQTLHEKKKKKNITLVIPTLIVASPVDANSGDLQICDKFAEFRRQIERMQPRVNSAQKNYANGIWRVSRWINFGMNFRSRARASASATRSVMRSLSI